MNIKRILLFLSIISLVVIPLHQAEALVNGGFESGFTGWTTAGDVTIDTSLFGSGPTAGLQEARLKTNGPTEQTLSQLQSFFSLPAGTLNGLGNGNVDEGSAIKQTFAANAGDVLSFDWNFLTRQTTPDVLNDFAYVVLNGQAITLANTHSTFFPTATTYFHETHFQTYTYNIPTTGNFTLGFSVVDVGIPGNHGRIISALELDNIQLVTPSSPVPEPATVLLLGSSFLGMMGFRRKS